MNRNESLSRIIKEKGKWDVVIIGGGASGLGVALDAISRGYSVLLLEQSDFAKGTSSRSTKLVHGGVRYLAQGNLPLVIEALRERGRMEKNASHLVKNQAFVIPVYTWWDVLKYTLGLKIYDLLAGNLSLGRSHFINKSKTRTLMPNIKSKDLKGGIVYHDGQFDDARLAISIARTCSHHGAVMLNYARVDAFVKDENQNIQGLTFTDMESGRKHKVKANSVVNATGVFADAILQMDNPLAKRTIVPSQGVHVVVDRSFLPGNHALMIPETPDGRVLFGVPWHGKLVLGTTDVLRENPEPEPKALESEIEFILETASAYLNRKPGRDDVLSTFAGLRPLAASSIGKSTKEISRGHKIMASSGRLITLTGGKWTTFRKMGEDTIDYIIGMGLLKKSKSLSKDLSVKGNTGRFHSWEKDHLAIYGTEKTKLIEMCQKHPELSDRIHPHYPFIKAEVIWAMRKEMARTVEDVLARRLRILFLDAEASLEMAPKVAWIMAKEWKKNENWVSAQIETFAKTASNFYRQTLNIA
ncbi:MAG: glycerol-3-phosphate dehydrogenase/oxidase [Cyclobacteriaceae bacterium]|nr:glycerol-3-phosphate dehydrogenase/oxidase [Cyclobacteriaceae bacterium]